MENYFQMGKRQCFWGWNFGLSLNLENMEKLKNITYGEILLEEFLIPLEISQYRLSKDLKIPQTRVSEIIKGNRRISADTAVRLSAYFINSAKFLARFTRRLWYWEWIKRKIEWSQEDQSNPKEKNVA